MNDPSSLKALRRCTPIQESEAQATRTLTLNEYEQCNRQTDEHAAEWKPLARGTLKFVLELGITGWKRVLVAMMQHSLAYREMRRYPGTVSTYR